MKKNLREKGRKRIRKRGGKRKGREEREREREPWSILACLGRGEIMADKTDRV